MLLPSTSEPELSSAILDITLANSVAILLSPLVSNLKPSDIAGFSVILLKSLYSLKSDHARCSLYVSVFMKSLCSFELEYLNFV